MRFITLTLLLSMLSCFTATGEAKTIRDLFASEPNNIFMLLRDRTRLDMLDYYDSLGRKWLHLIAFQATTLHRS